MLGTNNDYARALGDLLAEIPKTVFAAIAVSALTTGGEKLEDARGRVALEWLRLHQNGIVPQRPPARVTALAVQAEKDLDQVDVLERAELSRTRWTNDADLEARANKVLEDLGRMRTEAVALGADDVVATIDRAIAGDEKAFAECVRRIEEA